MSETESSVDPELEKQLSALYDETQEKEREREELLKTLMADVKEGRAENAELRKRIQALETQVFKLATHLASLM
jgi:polyhydroxyalkanoate synthesis regulator phasin